MRRRCRRRSALALGPRLPALGHRGEWRAGRSSASGVGSSVVWSRSTTVQPCSRVDDLDRVAGARRRPLDDAQVDAGPVGGGEALRKRGVAHPDAELEARLARLRDLEHDRADPPALADRRAPSRSMPSVVRFSPNVPGPTSSPWLGATRRSPRRRRRRPPCPARRAPGGRPGRRRRGSRRAPRPARRPATSRSPSDDRPRHSTSRCSPTFTDTTLATSRPNAIGPHRLPDGVGRVHARRRTGGGTRFRDSSPKRRRRGVTTRRPRPKRSSRSPTSARTLRRPKSAGPPRRSARRPTEQSLLMRPAVLCPTPVSGVGPHGAMIGVRFGIEEDQVEIKGKKAVVVGGASGMARAAAERLHERGARSPSSTCRTRRAPRSPTRSAGRSTRATSPTAPAPKPRWPPPSRRSAGAAHRGQHRRRRHRQAHPHQGGPAPARRLPPVIELNLISHVQRQPAAAPPT